jgi:hypothetical protein
MLRPAGAVADRRLAALSDFFTVGAQQLGCRFTIAHVFKGLSIAVYTLLDGWPIGSRRIK